MGEKQEDLGDDKVVEAAEGDEVGDNSPLGELAMKVAWWAGAPGHGLRDDCGQETELNEDDPGAAAAGGRFQAGDAAHSDGHKA